MSAMQTLVTDLWMDAAQSAAKEEWKAAVAASAFPVKGRVARAAGGEDDKWAKVVVVRTAAAAASFPVQYPAAPSLLALPPPPC